MALTLITITQDNVSWAVRENFRRIYRELAYKVPLQGGIVLEGDWDFDNTYSVFNVTADGDTSASSENVIDPA